jgi:3-deoxy-manno-octulosonate cytidylyltransferase (CMP-KDO synthetase)
MQNTFIGIIPARYASTRFPGKPLVLIDGKSMLQRVYEQALKTRNLKRVIVATDDDRIAEHVQGFGGEVMMTSPLHQSGTDRCAEVISKLETPYDIAINIQGDEPYIQPEQIDLLCSCFEIAATDIATLIKPTSNLEEINNPNVVKAVVSKTQRALYFSRSPIPYNRNKKEDVAYHKHIGIYAYRVAVLKQLALLPEGVLEQAESLEQLRWLENGFHIQTALTNFENIAIDTPEDLERLKKVLTNG